MFFEEAIKLEESNKQYELRFDPEKPFVRLSALEVKLKKGVDKKQAPIELEYKLIQKGTKDRDLIKIGFNYTPNSVCEINEFIDVYLPSVCLIAAHGHADHAIVQARARG